MQQYKLDWQKYPKHTRNKLADDYMPNKTPEFPEMKYSESLGLIRYNDNDDDDDDDDNDNDSTNDSDNNDNDTTGPRWSGIHAICAVTYSDNVWV